MNSRVKTLSGAKPCVSSGKVASVVAEVGSLFPGLRGSILKSAQRARFAPQNVKLTASEHFVHQTVARARFHIKIANCVNVGRFSGALLLCGFATDIAMDNCPCMDDKHYDYMIYPSKVAVATLNNQRAPNQPTGTVDGHKCYGYESKTIGTQKVPQHSGGLWMLTPQNMVISCRKLEPSPSTRPVSPNLQAKTWAEKARVEGKPLSAEDLQSLISEARCPGPTG